MNRKLIVMTSRHKEITLIKESVSNPSCAMIRMLHMSLPLSQKMFEILSLTSNTYPNRTDYLPSESRTECQCRKARTKVWFWINNLLLTVIKIIDFYVPCCLNEYVSLFILVGPMVLPYITLTKNNNQSEISIIRFTTGLGLAGPSVTPMGTFADAGYFR
jgi:hypothetical protein